MKSKAQASMEMLTIVMLALTFLIPLTNYIILYQTSYRDSYKINSAKEITETLAKGADSIFLQGYPAGITVTINMPEGVKETSISDKTVQLKVMTSSGLTDVFSFSKQNIQGSLSTSPGTHKILIKNEREFVSINEV
jgi:uncharacterized protein (UPF0333 family)